MRWPSTSLILSETARAKDIVGAARGQWNDQRDRPVRIDRVRGSSPSRSQPAGQRSERRTFVLQRPLLADITGPPAAYLPAGLVVMAPRREASFVDSAWLFRYLCRFTVALLKLVARNPPGFVSFAFPRVEDWSHPSAAGLRRAGLCAAQFSRPSFAFFPRSEHVPLSLGRLDLVRSLA
jgi:hypothetical protein